MRIAVTRHPDQLKDLQHRAASKNIEIVPLPLMSVHTPTAGKIRLLPVSVVLVVGVQSC